MCTNQDKTQLQKLTNEAVTSAKALTIYRGILRDPVCLAMLRFWEAVADQADANLSGELFSELFYLLSKDTKRPGDAWQNYLLDLILYDDNAFTREAAILPTDQLGETLKEAARGDLLKLHNMFRIDAYTAREALLQPGRLLPAGGYPIWRDLAGSHPALEPESATRLRALLMETVEWNYCLDQLATYHHQSGAGLFARYRAFRWLSQAGRLEGIETPDPVTMEDLTGYRSQRQEVLENTERLLAGLPANNMLLYGDRGTGKSSMVKALLNRFGETGLRMVETTKGDLADFPRLNRILRAQPLKFILFADDLSFEESEVEYKEMKAALEGSLESRPSNVVIYATSNRRHLVRERFADRQPEYGDEGEVRTGDTVQEKLSLADRFGITVLFMSPDKQLYLEIVRNLARRRNIPMSDEELTRRALLWEVWQNGRSGRSARQFIDHICGEAGLRPNY